MQVKNKDRVYDTQTYINYFKNLKNKQRTKHVYINNFSILLKTLEDLNLKQILEINLKRTKKKSFSIKLIELNSYSILFRHKIIFVNFNGNLVVCYCLDAIIGVQPNELNEEAFKDACNFCEQNNINFSISNWGYKQIEELYKNLDTRFKLPDNLFNALNKPYLNKAGYYLNLNLSNINKGKFYDYDINSAYLDALLNLDNFGDEIKWFRTPAEIDESHWNNCRFLVMISIKKGICKNRFPMRFSSEMLVYDFSNNPFRGLLADSELEYLLKNYKDLNYYISDCWVLYNSEEKHNFLIFADKVLELKRSSIKWKKAIGKSLYTNTIGSFSSQYKRAITLSNVLHQFILADVRSKVRNMAIKIENAGYLVYYIDTDGFATNCPPEVMTELGFKISKDIGDLKIERQGYNFMAIVECKQYLWQDEFGNINYKISGDQTAYVQKCIDIYKNKLLN